MIRLKANRVRLEPKREAIEKIRRFAGCKRFVWNRLFAGREEAYASLGPDPSHEVKEAFNLEWSSVGMQRKITEWRAETDWLAECPVHALQNAAKDLFTAYVNWWEGREEKPKFKWSSEMRSITGIPGLQAGEDVKKLDPPPPPPPTKGHAGVGTTSGMISIKSCALMRLFA